jgi:hypothetical protein
MGKHQKSSKCFNRTITKVSDNLASPEMKPRLDRGSGNATSGKPWTKVTQHRQATMAGIVGTALLVVVGIVGWV